jgi:hypothetical protein
MGDRYYDFKTDLYFIDCEPVNVQLGDKIDMDSKIKSSEE